MLVPVCARLLRIAIPLALALSLILSRPAAAQDAAASIDIHSGSVVFDVATNMPAISVHGKSTALEGHARVRQMDGGGLAIDQIEASVPIASLATGMSLRDAHMRKYVFTTSDGQTPDLRFEANHADCTRAGGREMACQMSGTLAIRGIARTMAMALRVSDSGGTGVLHAAGDVEIKLSAWQIDRPSQLGVQTADDVKLHIEFATRPAATITTTAANRGGR